MRTAASPIRTAVAAFAAAFDDEADSVVSVAFSPDGRIVATGTSNGMVLRGASDPGRSRRLAGVAGAGAGKAVEAVAFSPDDAVGSHGLTRAEAHHDQHRTGNGACCGVGVLARRSRALGRRERADALFDVTQRANRTSSGPSPRTARSWSRHHVQPEWKASGDRQYGRVRPSLGRRQPLPSGIGEHLQRRNVARRRRRRHLPRR